MKGPVKDQINRYRLGDRFGAERFMPTVGAAVDAVTGTFRGDLSSSTVDREAAPGVAGKLGS